MKPGDLILLLTLNTLLNGVISLNQFNRIENNEIHSQSSEPLQETHGRLLKKPLVSLINKKIASYEALQEPYEISHDDKEKDPPAFVANEGAVKSDSYSQSNQKVSSPSWIQSPGILAGIICTCLVLGLIFLLLVVFCIYRLRKRDEGSYALDEPKKMLPPSSEYSKAPTREFYA